MIHSCFFPPCLSWIIKLPAVLQKDPSGPCTHSLVFQPLLHIWTFFNNDCMILRSIFSHWGQLRDSYPTITKSSNTHWRSRRKNDAEPEVYKMCTFFLFCLNIYIFSFSTAFQKLQDTVIICLPEDKISCIYPDLQIQKVFTSRLLKNTYSIHELINKTQKHHTTVIKIAIDCSRKK